MLLAKSRKLNMKFSSIWAMVLRHLRLWKRDMNLVMMTLYWPLLDVLIWGFLGIWMQRLQQGAGQNFEMVFLLGILLWQVVARTSIWISASFDEEIQAYNLINLFTMPLRITEWIVGVLIFAFFLSLATSMYCIGLIMCFYTIPLWKMVSMFALFAPGLFISSIFIGFLGLQVLVTCGKRGREIMYIFSWAAAPFCSAFYPREVLPEWAKIVSYCLPMSYIFEAMRSYLLHGTNPWPSILFGTAMASVYAIITLVILIYLFNKSKQKGLVRLSD
jgi:ABC-2 type transport system permease protein